MWGALQSINCQILTVIVLIRRILIRTLRGLVVEMEMSQVQHHHVGGGVGEVLRDHDLGGGDVQVNVPATVLLQNKTP